MFSLYLPLFELDKCDGGAIFDTFSLFENAVESDAAVVDDELFRLLLLWMLLDNVLAAVRFPFDANSDAIRILLLGAGTIFDPCARFTCRIIPSGAIMWLHWLHNTIGPGSLGDKPYNSKSLISSRWTSARCSDNVLSSFSKSDSKKSN